MYKNFVRMRRQFEEFNFCPRTYLFPDEYRKFCSDREAENFKHMFIMKPAAASCGRGIKVIGKTQDVKKKNGYIVSQYLSSPLLINGFKFDLRIYALVTSFDPLKVYLFKEGLARFATKKYTNNPTATEKQFIHLTNYSVNKHNDDYVKNTGSNVNKNSEEGADDNASKWNLAQLAKYFDKIGVNFKGVMHRIKDVIIKTLISVEPHIVSTTSRVTRHHNLCFELFGFDILLDSKLKPWLLEVNISPSLSSSSPLDKKIKTVLICDTLNLVGVFPYDRKQYANEQEQVLKKRLLGLDRKHDEGIESDLVPDSFL
jgi:tubulin polyglutamylase TTLL4